MSSSLLQYFNNELNYLKSEGTAFAERYPKIAGRLKLSPDSIDDPFVARLMESFAFLSSRVQRKLDDEYHFLTGALLDCLYPHYQMPVPANCITSFSPKDQLESTYHLKRDTQLISRLADGTPCYFKTAFNIDVLPLTVDSLKLTRHLPSALVQGNRDIQSQLVGDLSITHQSLTMVKSGISSLRFYINLPTNEANVLYEQLFNHCESIVLESQDIPEKRIRLRPDKIKAVGFSDDEALLPLPAASFSGYRLLTEYFACPKKFLFFDVRDVDFAFLDKADTKFKIRFLFNEAKTDLETYINETSLVLNATPIVNLFEESTEPFHVAFDQSEYHLKTDHRISPDEIEIYQVKSLTAAYDNEGEEVDCVPFYGQAHRFSNNDEQLHWVSMRQACDEIGIHHTPGGEMFLAFNPSDDVLYSGQSVVVKAKVTCTNRERPNDLPYVGGKILFEFGNASEPMIASVQSVSSMMRPLYRDTRQKKRDLINHLMTNNMSYSEHEHSLSTLQSILAQYHFLQSDHQKMVEQGLLSVETKTVIERHPTNLKFGFCQGVHYTLRIDESAFSENSAFIFVTVLNQFLSRTAMLNAFVTLNLESQQRGEIKTWKPELGKQRLL
jgi:type VI secretion system protein ImpG